MTNRLPRLALALYCLKAVQFRGLTYNRQLGRYRSTKTGRFLSPVEVRGIIDAEIDIRASRFDRHANPVQVAARQLLDGEITKQQYQGIVDEWGATMLGEVRALYVGQLAAAKGGIHDLGPADYGRAGQVLRAKYEYLRRFHEQVRDDPRAVITENEEKNGTPGSRFVQRCEAYAEDSRGFYEVIRKMEDDGLGLVWTFNVLDDQAVHCTGPTSCPNQTDKGVVHSSEMVLVGLRPCKFKCRCMTPRYATKREAEREWRAIGTTKALTFTNHGRGL